MLATGTREHGEARMTTPNASGPRQGRPRLRRARTERGWSQTVAAREIYLRGVELRFREGDLGVNATQISRWERGEVDPGPIYTTIMCDLYARPPDQLDLLSHVLPIDVSETQPPASREPLRLSATLAPVSGASFTLEPDGEFVSIPVRTADGVIAYVITRRTFLARLATTMPALAAAGSIPPEMPAAISLSDPVEALVHSGRISDRTVSSFTMVTRLLASQRQGVAPDALLSLVAAHRDSVAALFRKAASEQIRRGLGALLGETSIVASRLWSAMGDRSMALANCAFARRLADELDDPALGAMARLFESNLHSDAATLIGSDGDIVFGLRMLSEAAAAAHLLPATARARIAAEQAQAYAVLTLKSECQDALSRAHRAVEEIGDGDRIGLFSDWNPARLLVYEGTCWLFLGEPKKAITALNEALGASDQGNQNVALAANVDLASAYADAGELEQGCTILGETYARLAALGNHRGLERARRARERLRLFDHELPVRRLDDRIRSIDVQ